MHSLLVIFDKLNNVFSFCTTSVFVAKEYLFLKAVFFTTDFIYWYLILTIHHNNDVPLSNSQYIHQKQLSNQNIKIAVNFKTLIGW